MNDGDQIKVDIYSRPNSLNGKYKAAKLELDNLSNISDIFFLQTMRMRADLADKVIAEAESKGIDTANSEVMRDLGKEIIAKGKPIHRSESRMTAVIVSLQLITIFGLAGGFWGLVFTNSFSTYGLIGGVVGLIISFFLVVPVISAQRTKEQIKNVTLGVNIMWNTLGIILAGLGLISWIVKIIL